MRAQSSTSPSLSRTTRSAWARTIGSWLAMSTPVPFSAHVLATLRAVCAENGTGVLIASHDPIVQAHADRVVRLSDGLVEA